jgi:hypothetical protein
VEQIESFHRYESAANLVFGRPDDDGEYRWHEMSFWTMAPTKGIDEPFTLDHVWDVDKALSKVFDPKIQRAHQPVPIDGEDGEDFIDYWTDIVAQAAVGRLRRPTSMPINR